MADGVKQLGSGRTIVALFRPIPGVEPDIDFAMYNMLVKHFFSGIV
jgi:hypothetical protein